MHRIAETNRYRFNMNDLMIFILILQKIFWNLSNFYNLNKSILKMYCRVTLRETHIHKEIWTHTKTQTQIRSLSPWNMS